MPYDNLVVVYKYGLTIGVHPEDGAGAVVILPVRIVECNLRFAAGIS